MNWKDVPIVAFDTETTGLNPHDGDRVIEFAAVKIWADENGHVARVEPYEKLFNPGIPIPRKVTEITGIDDDTVADAPEFETHFRRQGILGVHPWLIHNDTNKRVRIRRLGPLLAARRLRLKADCPSTKLFLHQLQEFPLAAHDDGPDALEMSLRLATEMLAGVPNDGLGNRLPVSAD